MLRNLLQYKTSTKKLDGQHLNNDELFTNYYNFTKWYMKPHLCIFLILSHLLINRSTIVPLVNIYLEDLSYKTNHYMNSFLPSTIKLWNALINEIKQNPSISNSKHILSTKSPRRKIPLYYLTGSRIERILNTRVRLNIADY